MEKYGKIGIIPDLKEAKEEEIYDVLQTWRVCQVLGMNLIKLSKA